MTGSPTRSSSKPEDAPIAQAALDTVVAAETPEGILLELRPAGLVARLYAFLIDWAIRLAVLYAAALTAMLAGGLGTAIWLILLFVFEWFYPTVFELTPGGATPGKRALGLKVVMDSGLPVTAAASVTRNLLRAADFLPFAYGFAIVSLLLRADGKRLGDLAAATLVVHVPRRVSRTGLADVPPVVPVRPLTREDQAALIALAAPVSGDAGRRGPQVTRRVLGVAQWALGRR